MNPHIKNLTKARGMTLIELMIVVAIIGVIASIGGVSYMKHVKQGKITKLKQYAMTVSLGQENYRARNNTYYNPPGNANEYTSTVQPPEWTNLLEFSAAVEQGVTIRTEAGVGGNCSICDGGVAPDTTRAWYAVRVRQNMNPGTTAQTTIILHNDVPEPVVLNEGE